MKTNGSAQSLMLFGVCLFLLLGTERAVAASFPEKPVKIIANFPAGSVIDMEARGVAPFLEKYLGVSVMVENVTGADGKIGLIKLWKSKPDGTTLIYHTTTMSIIVEQLSNPEYRIADLSHVFGLTRSNQVLVVHPEKWKTFDEFMNAARSSTLSAGLAGRGSTSHLNGLQFSVGAGIKVNWVPFDGAPGALAAVAGKHIDFAIASTTSATSLAKAGKLKPLVVLANSQDIAFPDVKLLKDFGYTFRVFPPIRGIDGPPKMEAGVVETLEKAFLKASKDPDFLGWAKKTRTEIIGLGAQEYGEEIRSEAKEVETFKDLLKGEK